MSAIEIDKSWTLFLDRDGVINKKIEGGYVLSWNDFEFLPETKDAIANLSFLFGRIIVITNQQCIGKGLLTLEILETMHAQMIQDIANAGGRIDAVFYAPDLEGNKNILRKPDIGMGLKAKEIFPEINFKKSVMIGDSFSDMQFGKRLEMSTILIGEKGNPLADFCCPSLAACRSVFSIAG